ncbi:MAG: MFS transporter [Actinomycetota bacterium]
MSSKVEPALTERRKLLSLVLLGATQFMVVLDVAIINVALPTIQKALKFPFENLQWVTTAYAITFGGLLLLGGRAADLIGRKRMFMIGLVVFSAASLSCGLATSSGFLIAARAIQGIGAAIISPAALSILVTTFKEGPERNRALGVWGGIAGFGGVAGVLLGGILVGSLGWRWIFFINVPVGALVLIGGLRVLIESRVERDVRRYDVAGSVSVTAGLMVLVYALVGTIDRGWTSGRSLGLFALAIGLLAAFVVIESRSKEPVLPLSIFRNRTLSGANVVGFLVGAGVFSMFLFLSFYMQGVLGYSALRTGLYYVPFGLVIIVAAGVSQMLVTKIGIRTVMAVGLLLVAAAQVWFSRAPIGGHYILDLFPGFVIGAIGLGFAFVPDAIAALQGVPPERSGVASGLINTSQQIGGALGVAVLLTVAVSHTNHLIAAAAQAGSTGRAAQVSATLSGYHRAFLVGAGMSVLGALATVLFVRPAVGTDLDAELEALELEVGKPEAAPE